MNIYGPDFNGTDFDDNLYGTDADEFMDGWDGWDNLWAYGGDDYLYGGNGNDYLDAADGDDTLSGESGRDDLWGGSGHDYLYGGDGNDYLDGEDGDDTLAGGNGRDEMWGGDGYDIFELTGTGVDQINDFNVGIDTIQLNSYELPGLATGTLSASQFIVGDEPLDSDDHVLYDSSYDELLYDADGSGDADAIVIARVNSDLYLTNTDIVVI